MSPRLMLYRMELDDEFGEPYYVEVTIPEVVAWLREQGAVDSLATGMVCTTHWAFSTSDVECPAYGARPATCVFQRATLWPVVDAALPPTGETL